MDHFPITPANRVRRVANRGCYDKDTIYQIVDEALYCHVAFVHDGQPFAIPTIHARRDDSLILHGARESRLLKHVGSGEPICVAVTLLDGLVFARSVLHHSMNFRSAVLFGRGRTIEDADEKVEALRVLTEHVTPGRWDEARRPSLREINRTLVVVMTIESASAKFRSGPPADDAEDLESPVWAGVLPMRLEALEPVDDPGLADGISVPEYIRNYGRTVGR